MKKQSVYKRKLARAIRSAFREVNNVPEMTASEACARLLEISKITVDKP